MGEPFDLALLDPPYRRGLADKALDGLAAGGWLKPGAIAMVERASDEPTPAPRGFASLDIRDYGAARVQFLRFDGPA